MGDGIWTGERYVPGMSTLGDFAGPGGYRGGGSEGGPGWVATLGMVAPGAFEVMSRGSLVISEGFGGFNLAVEFEVVRSAIIRLVEQGAGKNAHYGTLAEVCVARFNVHIEQIERWRDSQLVGFSATRLRAEALEPELNAAILEIGKEDFLLENFDLQSLFSESLNRYYSDEVVLWLGTELTNGKKDAFQRLADVLEPVHTVLEMGVGCVDVFRLVSSFQDSQGDLISEWETVLGGPYSTGAAIRWRTPRLWNHPVAIPHP